MTEDCLWTQEAVDCWVEHICSMAAQRNRAARELVQGGRVFMASAFPDTRPDEVKPS